MATICAFAELLCKKIESAIKHVVESLETWTVRLLSVPPPDKGDDRVSDTFVPDPDDLLVHIAQVYSPLPGDLTELCEQSIASLLRHMSMAFREKFMNVDMKRRVEKIEAQNLDLSSFSRAWSDLFEECAAFGALSNDDGKLVDSDCEDDNAAAEIKAEREKQEEILWQNLGSAVGSFVAMTRTQKRELMLGDHTCNGFGRRRASFCCLSLPHLVAKKMHVFNHWLLGLVVF